MGESVIARRHDEAIFSLFSHCSFVRALFVILSEVEGSVSWYTNRWFGFAHHDIAKDCFVPRNDGLKNIQLSNTQTIISASYFFRFQLHKPSSYHFFQPIHPRTRIINQVSKFKASAFNPFLPILT